MMYANADFDGLSGTKNKNKQKHKKTIANITRKPMGLRIWLNCRQDDNWLPELIATASSGCSVRAKKRQQFA